MKRIRVRRASEIETGEFVPLSIGGSAPADTAKRLDMQSLRKKSRKKYLEKTARRHGIEYDKEKLAFAGKLINILIDEMENGK